MPPSDARSLAAPLDAGATATALDAGAVARWWQSTAFLDVAGPDAATLLDGLCTQAVERIQPGTAVLGLFLDAKAKVIAPAVLHRVDDATWTDPRRGTEHPGSPHLLLETLPALVEPLRAHLARYRLRAKASVEPVELGTVAVVGAEAERLVRDVAAPAGAGWWTVVAGEARPTVAFTGTAEACAQLVRELLPGVGIALADPDALEADRIDAGVAGLHDLLPGRMPAEVGGMATAVALDAGCYLGQEPVARLHYRGRANRTLRRLHAEHEVVPAAPAVDADGEVDVDAAFALLDPTADAAARPLGRLTTWARRGDGTTVALAVLRREVDVDQRVQLAGTDVALHPVDAAPD